MIRPSRFFIVFAVLAPSCSFAWNDTGHMVVAKIASHHLNAHARQMVDRLAKIGTDAKTDDCVTIACFVDDHKSDKDRHWHYFDTHFRADGKPSTNKGDEENIVWALDKFTNVLRSATATDVEKAEALRYISHFLGDIHQPLHLMARDTDEFPKGDRGGNDFSVGVINDWGANRPIKNLHIAWDFGLGEFPQINRPLTDEDAKRIEDMALTIEKEFPLGKVKVGESMNPSDWGKESFALRDQVYNTREGAFFTADYLKTCRTLIRKQVALAGYRLAELLNRTWK
ncbi:MAG: S1/P1 nuclease [Armatimonadetes bacterium]|nr:S1/P1 nuclease [Armatimonadota bacterium]